MDEFKEKPDLDLAIGYIKNGHLWNSGMFLFDSELFKEEVKKYCLRFMRRLKLNDIKDIYELAPDISIDYGVLEKSNKVAVIPLNIT